MILTRKDWGIIEGLLRRRIAGETKRIEKKDKYLNPEDVEEIRHKIQGLINLMDKVRKEKNLAPDID